VGLRPTRRRCVTGFTPRQSRDFFRQPALYRPTRWCSGVR
jgi:hypothetical protein